MTKREFGKVPGNAMPWHSVDVEDCVSRGEIFAVLHGSLSRPLNVVRPGGVLYAAPVHHFAIVLKEQKVRHWATKLEQEYGFTPIEPLHLWPDEAPGCPMTPPEHQAIMASFQGDGIRIVLLAPAHENCVLAHHISKVGEGLHHVAFEVDDIEAAAALLGVLGLRQITALADDEPELKQVFFKQDPDPRIIELVECAPGFAGTFKCGNIRTLIDGERRNGFITTTNARAAL